MLICLVIYLLHIHLHIVFYIIDSFFKIICIQIQTICHQVIHLKIVLNKNGSRHFFMKILEGKFFECNYSILNKNLGQVLKRKNLVIYIVEILEIVIIDIHSILLNLILILIIEIDIDQIINLDVVDHFQVHH
jgi:hypothetical protein